MTPNPTSIDSPRRRAVDRLPRLSGWLLIAVLLAGLVWLFSPQQLPLSLYKLSLVALGGVVGYWLDRRMFPYARPDKFLPCEAIPLVDGQLADGAFAPELQTCELRAVDDPESMRLAGICMLRRALIVAAAMLAMGLGA